MKVTEEMLMGFRVTMEHTGSLEDALSTVLEKAVEAGVVAEPHFNQLTPEQHESLAIMMEESAEVIQAVCKIMRHGLDSCHPVSQIGNRRALECEMADLKASCDIVEKTGMVDSGRIEEQRRMRPTRMHRYVHHIGAFLARRFG